MAYAPNLQMTTKKQRREQLWDEAELISDGSNWKSQTQARRYSITEPPWQKP